ncbi:hypothetical protein [Methylocystis sp.]|uniref:hypothetical protein n=1 Tax=Methylocystis sp. TaxID=1911079 RepID=UPI00273401DB|nr:hypothetical protein [Methylocystis sp.]MDP3552812.1 hypothetical protein [Methylocystis sp.]
MSRQAFAMKKQTDPDLVGSWTFEAIRKFAGAATGGEVAAMQESFKRQAELFRRNGDDGRAAFWEAMANRVADAAARSGRRGAEALPRIDVA